MPEERNDCSLSKATTEGENKSGRKAGAGSAMEVGRFGADSAFGFYLVFGLLITVLVVVVLWILGRPEEARIAVPGPGVFASCGLAMLGN